MGRARVEWLGPAALVAALGACQDRPATAEVIWRHDLAAAATEAKTVGKPLFVFVWASWDAATAEYERTFRDPAVAPLLRDAYLTSSIDCTDEHQPPCIAALERLKVIGPPAVRVIATSGAEVLHEDGLVDATQLRKLLEQARARP